MSRQEVFWHGRQWTYASGDPLPTSWSDRVFQTKDETDDCTNPPVYRYWIEDPYAPKLSTDDLIRSSPRENVKWRTLYTLTVNGIEIEAEEKVWRKLRQQLVDLFGVYDPLSEER